MQKSVWKLSCRVFWRVLSCWYKSRKLFSHLSLSPGKLLWHFLAQICVLLLFWCSSISWEPFNCFTLHFYRCSWYYTEVCLNKETFLHTASPPLLGAILRYFGAHFGVCSSIIESCSHLTLWNFVHVFCIILTINVLRKISHHAFLCLGHYAAYFGYIPQCLEKLKTFFWYFAWMSWYYCGGHYNKKCVWFPLALGIFGCFWPILYYVPQIVRNHVTFSSEFFRYVA